MSSKFNSVLSGTDLISSKSFLAETVVSPSSKIVQSSIISESCLSRSVATIVKFPLFTLNKTLESIGIVCLFSAIDEHKESLSPKTSFFAENFTL